MADAGDRARYYDQLYQHATFEPKYYEDKSTAIDFRKIITTFEFNRLNFIRQEGITWLAFHSTAHTRFSASLGCWYLATYGVENIVVQEDDKSRLLQDRLRELGWLEEFRLAVLLHDVGHFPFTRTIETNDDLKEAYKKHTETDKEEGIELRHEQIGMALVSGTGRTFKLFEEYIEKQVGTEILNQDRYLDGNPANEAAENRREIKDRKYLYLHELLPKLKKRREHGGDNGCIDLEKIEFLLDPETKDHPVLKKGKLKDPEGEDASDEVQLQAAERKREFIRLVSHLVIGYIDVGLLDRFNRASAFVSREGEMPIRGLLNHLRIVDKRGDDPKNPLPPRFVFTSPGITEVTQTLFAINAVTKNVFHNVERLAYEAMLNYAIKNHWYHGCDKGCDDTDQADHERFRTYLPFLHDSELLGLLLKSKSEEARKTTVRLIHRDPFYCVGHFRCDKGVYDELGVDDKLRDDDELRDVQKERRRKFSEEFRQSLKTQLPVCIDEVRKCIVELAGRLEKDEETEEDLAKCKEELAKYEEAKAQLVKYEEELLQYEEEKTPKEKYLVRLTKSFGTDPHGDPLRPKCLDLNHIYGEEGQTLKPIKKMTEHSSTAQILGQEFDKAIRSFWVFIPYESEILAEVFRRAVEDQNLGEEVKA